MQFVVVNEAGPTFEANIEEFTSRSTMPIFQDVEALNIWRQLGGTEDDVYIYGSNGELITFQAILTSPSTSRSPRKRVTRTFVS